MDDHPPIAWIITANYAGYRRVADHLLKPEPVNRIDMHLGQHRVATWQPNVCRLNVPVSHLVSAPARAAIDVGVGVGFAAKVDWPD